MPTKIFLLVLIIWSCPTFGTTLVGSTTIQEALEISISQQVLSQQIAKIYLALCCDSKNIELYRARRESINAFEEQLHQLSVFVVSDGVKEEIQKVRTIWKDYKAIADWTIKKEAAYDLLNKAQLLLDATKSLHASYQEYNRQFAQQTFYKVGIINQYLKQTNHNLVLTQQILMFYLAEKLKIDSPNFLYRLQEAEKEFVRGIYVLDNAKMKNNFIDEKTKEVHLHWQKIQSYLSTIHDMDNHWEKILFYGEQINYNLQKLHLIYCYLGTSLLHEYALNLSYHLSILSRQIPQYYLVVFETTTADNYSTKITTLMTHFEKNMLDIHKLALDTSTTYSINQLETTWQVYKKQDLTSKNSPEQMLTFLKQTNLLIEKCDHLLLALKNSSTKHFTNETNKEFYLDSLHTIQLVQLSNEMEFANQAIGFYNLLQLSKHSFMTDNSNNLLNQSIQHFEANFKKLKNCPPFSQLNSALFQEIEKNWTSQKEACQNPTKEHLEMHLQRTASISESLLKISSHFLSVSFKQ